MIPFLPNQFLRAWIPALILLAVFCSTSPAHAMPCSLYEGDGVLQSVQDAKAQLEERFQRLPVGHRNYCRMAHLDYKLSRWLPDQREHHLKRCLEHVERALHHNPEAGTAYFLRGLCLGRLGELQGLKSSLDMIKPFRRNMEMALKLDPDIDHGGPHRALGRLYYELPFILGGDMEKSIQHLESAVRRGPDYWENHYYLGESYMSRDRYREAQRELQAALRLARSVNDQPDIDDHRRRMRELLSEVERRMD